ncbi:MAG TPA: GAF domain-containing protein [Blastocatellia bacterium]|nr:GAF domain-containing protein [Blastocatellia bacterium]
MAKLYYFYGRREETTIRDTEPNQAPILIQPHGAIIVVKEPALTILQVSANTEPHFGFAPEELLGQPLSMLMSESEIERLRGQRLSRNPQSTTHYLEAARIGKDNKVFELLLHRFQGLLILECERKPDDAIPQQELCPAVNNAIARMQRAESVRDVCQNAADEMRRLTGFDRVMVYKFKGDDSGEVIAESLGGDFESYLGLRIANCKLRSGNQGLRVVVDVDGQPSPLAPPGDGAPPDLRRAVTRNLSPTHIKHLTHLGVKASMFVPITQDDRLWGLIALHHHRGPKYVPHNTRMACECMARFLSLQTALKESVDNRK